ISSLFLNRHSDERRKSASNRCSQAMCPQPMPTSRQAAAISALSPPPRFAKAFPNSSAGTRNITKSDFSRKLLNRRSARYGQATSPHSVEQVENESCGVPDHEPGLRETGQAVQEQIDAAKNAENCHGLAERGVKDAPACGFTNPKHEKRERHGDKGCERSGVGEQRDARERQRGREQNDRHSRNQRH